MQAMPAYCLTGHNMPAKGQWRISTKGLNGLAALVQSHLKKKPFDGAVYVLCAKRADRLKMIQFWVNVPFTCRAIGGTGLASSWRTNGWSRMRLNGPAALLSFAFKR